MIGPFRHETPEALRHDAQLAIQTRLAADGPCAEGASAWAAEIVALLEEVELRTVCVASRGGEAGDYVMAELVHVARRRHARKLIRQAEEENAAMRQRINERWRRVPSYRRGDRLRQPLQLALPLHSSPVPQTGFPRK